ncbi:MAG: carbon starvation CstA 5TM domain-containing protein, partial [Phycisphaerae bacterium]
GFHSLVSSGTTPKMIKSEGDARIIGYGAMLIEGLVGIVALIAAASLPNAHYYHMNTAWQDYPQYRQQIAQIAGDEKIEHDLPTIERQVGETLQGRTGGAVTLAVGMSEIFDQAAKNIVGTASQSLERLEKLIPYWYHFAIMFEALFILTTIDTGTRVGRFLLQEIFGKIHPQWGRPSYWPSAVLSTGLLVLGWWYFLDSNSMAAIWPMFGISNQLLAVMALAIASVCIVRSGKGRYVWVTLVPMAFVTLTTLTTAVIMVWERYRMITGQVKVAAGGVLNAWIATLVIVGIVICSLVVLAGAIRAMAFKPVGGRGELAPVPPPEDAEDVVG